MKKVSPSLITLDSKNRLYQMELPIIAITGGIATGKSSVTDLLTKEGYFVICADKLVKNIYQTKEALDFISDHFPTAVDNSKINFKKLREIAFSSKDDLSKIEQFIYSHLPSSFKNSAKLCRDQDFLIYDVPLLYEKKLDQLVDYKVCVYAPRKVQKERLTKRDQTSIDTVENILDEQMDIEQKKSLSDYVINNSRDLAQLKDQVDLFASSCFTSS